MSLIFFIFFLFIIQVLTQTPETGIQTATINGITLSIDPKGGIITYTREDISETTVLTPRSIIEKNLTGTPVNKNTTSTLHQIPSFEKNTYTISKTRSNKSEILFNYTAQLFELKLSSSLPLQIYFFEESGKYDG